ncbi:MAG TPA: hypothetical protein VMR74_07110 [Gammaproteobacteria bacterium]|nr:hypothetical protein [Gammaproteobacteria bacterium]
MSFLGEIKRRKAFQVAAVYAVVAWLLVQVVVAIEDPLNLPEWMDTFIITVLAIGFPVTLLLSWAFNVTPKGIVHDQGEARERGGRRIEFALIGLLAIAVVWLVYRDMSPGTSAASAGSAEISPHRVAVLPCDDFSPNPENAWFAQGIHEEILNQLGKIHELNVIARITMLQYAGRPATDIATELGVGLETELLPAERRSIEQAPTDSAEAYAYYLQAMNALSGQGSLAALADLDRAIELDAEFALAYAHRARTLGRSIVNTSIGTAFDAAERDSALDRAFADAERALTLEPANGLAHVARARIHAYTWRFAEALADLEQAIRASPNDPVVLRDYGLVQAYAGDPAGAIEQSRRSISLDPRNYEAYFYFGLASLFSGDGPAALAAYRQALEQNETAAVERLGYFGGLEARFGDPVEGERLVRLAEELANAGGIGGAMTIPQRAYSYRQLGLEDDARRVVEEFRTWAESNPAGAGDWAMTYLAIGDAEQALQWLQRAVGKVEANEPDEGFWNLGHIRGNVFADPILERPEFIELRRKLGAAI